jgi:hypothetical protein
VSYTDYTIFEAMDEQNSSWRFRGVVNADNPEMALTQYLDGNTDPSKHMVVATRFVVVYEQKQETVTTLEKLTVPMNEMSEPLDEPVELQPE